MPLEEVIWERGLPLTVNRWQGDAVSGGYVTPQYAAVTGLIGHMQPLTDKELRQVPEGQNTLEWWNVWCTGALEVGDYVTDGVAPLVKLLKRQYWKEGEFWHMQGVKTTDNLTLPQGG